MVQFDRLLDWSNPSKGKPIWQLWLQGKTPISIYEHGGHNNFEARLCTLSNFPSKCIEEAQTLLPLAF